jgi:DDE family transposase
MLSVARLSKTLQPLLTTVADEAAREAGFVKRVRRLSGATFVQTLVCGWLGRPDASYSQLAQTGAACGLMVSPQGLEQRFTEPAAACLQRVLAAAMRQVLAAEPVALPVLRRFAGVYVSDSTTIALPDALAPLWRGCGGRVATNTQAGLKVQVRWELTSGALELLELQAGRGSDRAADGAAPPLPPGALRLVDLGYVCLQRLAAWRAAGVAVLCRLPLRPAVFDAAGRRRAAAALLAAQPTETVDLPVTLGTAERVPCRLVARRVPPAVAAERRRQWRAEAKREGRTVSKARRALADWDAVITTVPPEQLTAEEALTLLRARWQVELLFKLWKQHGRVDAWRSAKPWRILCEVYAKLLALLIQHWCLLLVCWADPCRSLVKAAAVVRQHATALACAQGRAAALRAALTTLAACLGQAGRVTTRRARPATAHRLLALQPLDAPLEEVLAA